MREFVRNFVRIKGLGFILLALAVGVLLVFMSGQGRSDEDGESKPGENFSFEQYEHELEERLEEMISRIDGVSSVSVMVMLDQSYEEIGGYGNLYNTTSDADDGNTRVAPKVRGIAVICRGGEQIETKREIINLLSSLLGVSTNRIYVGGIG